MRLRWIPAFVELTRRRRSGDVENCPQQDRAEGDRRVISAAFVVRASLQRRSFKAAPGDSLFHEQYLNAVVTVTQRAEGLQGSISSGW
jgi:hypothetical protein